MFESSNNTPSPASTLAECAFCAHIDDITLIPCYVSPSPCPACTSALEIHSQILSLKSTFYALLTRQSALHTSMNAQHDKLSSNLPPEIIGRIFEWCVPSEELFEAPGMTPFVLSAVSHTWRTIAFSTKLLWASVSITLSRDDPSARADFAERWIARSGDKPLYLIVRSAEKANEVSIQSSQLALAPYFSVINGCSTRWRTLVLNVSTNVLKKIGGDSICGAPNLESLILEKKQFKDIGARGTGGVFNSDNAASHFSLYGENIQSPTPTTISLKGFSPQTIIHLNLDALTTFTASNFTSSDVLYILETAPRLISCKFEKVRYMNSDDPITAASYHIPPPPHIIHQSLVSLTFSNGSRMIAHPDTPFPRILDALTLPSLKTLEITDHVYLILFKLHDLTLRSSSPKITSLALTSLTSLTNDPPSSHQAIVSMLGTIFPSLESLIRSGCAPCETELLFHNLISSSTFPKLKRLELEVVGERVWEWNTVVRLLDTSNKSDPSSRGLTSLKLTLKPDEDHMALSELFSEDTTQHYIDLESLVHLERIRREDEGMSIVIEGADGQDMMMASRKIWDARIARNVSFSN